MANTKYVVLNGISYPPDKRAEPGEVVSDLPGDSIGWLLEQGHIESEADAKKRERETLAGLASSPVEDLAATATDNGMPPAPEAATDTSEGGDA